MNFAQLRQEYHRHICADLIRIRKDARKGDYPNNADGDSKISAKIAWESSEDYAGSQSMAQFQDRRQV